MGIGRAIEEKNGGAGDEGKGEEAVGQCHGPPCSERTKMWIEEQALLH